MNDLIDFFKDLFTTELWPARWNCGYWSPFHGWMYIISDLVIWFAYFAIPVIILTYIYRKKYELKYTKTYILFASFILLCGSTHLLDASMFWTPVYRFNGLVRAITAITSIATVYHLLRILPGAFRMKTSVVLEREIAKRIDAERKLAEANEGLQAFAYMASHDLQEPVRKIQLFTSQLYQENKNVLDEKSVQWAEKTVNAASRMERMIRDILNLSSISETVTLEPTPLNDVIREVLSDLEGRIAEKGALIETDELPVVEGYHPYLVQLFTNLIGNALKFTEKTPEIRISSEERNGTFAISVRDNGIGFDPAQSERIFQAFQRLHPKSKYDGTGIGLAICKKIVEIHKGTVSAQSTPGAGTTFVIEFPAMKGESPTQLS